MGNEITLYTDECDPPKYKATIKIFFIVHNCTATHKKNCEFIKKDLFHENNLRSSCNYHPYKSANS